MILPLLIPILKIRIPCLLGFNEIVRFHLDACIGIGRRRINRSLHDKSRGGQDSSGQTNKGVLDDVVGYGFYFKRNNDRSHTPYNPTTYFPATTLLRSTPTPSISTSTVSPGSIPEVVPGVPVKMRSPGFRVTWRLMTLTMVRTSLII